MRKRDVPLNSLMKEKEFIMIKSPCFAVRIGVMIVEIKWLHFEGGL